MLARPFQGHAVRQLCPSRGVTFSVIRRLTDGGPSQRIQSLRTPPPSSPLQNTTKSTAADSPSPTSSVVQPASIKDEIVPTEAYRVLRTPTRNLPVYQYSKHGGNLKMTRVRKLAGHAETLRAELEAVLSPTPQYIKINTLTGHIFMKVFYAGGQLNHVLRP